MLAFFWAVHKNNNTHYYVYLKSPHTKVYKGPSNKSPVAFILTQQAYPLCVRAEYDYWLKIEDNEGPIGWIHRSLTSKKNKYALIIRETPLIQQNYLLQKGCVVQILKTNPQQCFIKVQHKKTALKGWVERKNLWGFSG